jgi:NAD(P)-dependent dehydrogenase (short-subunit alcohol dehydrogenase family)
LVNNASVFYPTPLQNASKNDWHKIIDSNLMAPFFLSQSVVCVFNAWVSVSSACASVAELMRIWLSSSAKVCASVPECR